MSAAATTTSASHAHNDIDERIAARNAVELAGEKWRSLVTEHATTFVEADRRSASIQEALVELLIKIDRETRPVVERVGKALDPVQSKQEGADDYADYEEESKKYDDEDDDKEDGGPILSASALLADLAEKHRLRRRMLVHHSSLLELLELPSLMDACVRGSLYDDALSIAGFANTLERRHLLEQSGLGLGRQQHMQRQQQQKQEKGRSTKKDGSHSLQQQQQQQKDGDVVSGVVFEIRRREADLRRMLIHRLRQDVSMPQCLEVVTALRRLNSVELERRNNINSMVGSGGTSAVTLSPSDHDLEGVHAAMEMRLQVDFLEARDTWLEAGITKIGSAQAAAVVAIAASSGDGGLAGTSAQAEQILDGIERYRTRFFDIVTQFLAIFRGSLAPSTNNHDHSFSLLSMWTARRIQTFLTALSSNLETHATDAATLRDALDAASFFASSMGRVGADFQPLLAPIFEPRLTKMIASQWSDGLSSMVETLKTCMDAGIAGPLVGAETSLNDDGNNGYSNVEDGIEMLQSTRTPAPPRKLLALPPLARFLNAYLGGLNELRRCLLPGAFSTIRSEYRKLIHDTKMALQSNERAALTPGLRGEASRLREVASKMNVEFENCLIPYMNDCLEVALGSFDFAVVRAKSAALAEKNAHEAALQKKFEKEAAERASAETEALERAREEAAEKAKRDATTSAEVADLSIHEIDDILETADDLDQYDDDTIEVL